MADVFISYAREDTPRARALADALSAKGWSVWWDRRIPHGEDFRAVIQQELDGARCIVVLWSATSKDSPFVRDEADEGKAAAGRPNRLIPVLLDRVTPPLGFRSLRAADLTDWNGQFPHDEFDQLAASIQAMLPTGGGSPQMPTPLVASRPRRFSQKARERPLIPTVVAGFSLVIVMGLFVINWPITQPSSQPDSPAFSGRPIENQTSHKPTIPDINQARRSFRARIEEDLSVNNGTRIIRNPPPGLEGFFEVLVPPTDVEFSFATVQLRHSVRPNFFASVRLIGGEGIWTLELVGRDVYFLVNPRYEKYLFWSSHDNQTTWQEMDVDKSVSLHTLGLHQVGRTVNAFIDSQFLATFQLFGEPQTGPVGIAVKADPRRGGTAQIQRLAVWEF